MVNFWDMEKYHSLRSLSFRHAVFKQYVCVEYYTLVSCLLVAIKTTLVTYCSWITIVSHIQLRVIYFNANSLIWFIGFNETLKTSRVPNAAANIKSKKPFYCKSMNPGSSRSRWTNSHIFLCVYADTGKWYWGQPFNEEY